MRERETRGVRCGLGIAREHGDFESRSGFERFAASDGEHTPTISRRHASVRLGHVQSSRFRSTKSLISELRIANLSISHDAQNLERETISIKPIVIVIAIVDSAARPQRCRRVVRVRENPSAVP